MIHAAPHRLALAALAVIALCSNAALCSDRSDFSAGFRLCSEGRWAAAATAFEPLSKQKGSLAAAARFNLALCDYQQGKFDAARAVFSSLTDSETGLLRAQAVYNLGNCCYRLGRNADAAAAYRRTIDLASQAAPNAKDAVELKDLRDRAAFNLALTEKAVTAQAPAPQQGTPSGSKPTASSEQAQAPSETANSDNAVKSSEAISGEVSAQTPVDVDKLLEGALSGDTGPVIPRPVRRKAAGGKDW